MKAKETGYNVSFFSFPMGKSAKQSVADCCGLERFDAKVLSLRKILKFAVATFNFVSGIAISDRSSVDYIPTVNMGYEKQRSTRRTETSTKAWYLTNSDLASDEEGKRRAIGVTVPKIGAVTTVGIVEPSGITQVQCLIIIEWQICNANPRMTYRSMRGTRNVI